MEWYWNWGDLARRSGTFTPVDPQNLPTDRPIVVTGTILTWDSPAHMIFRDLKPVIVIGGAVYVYDLRIPNPETTYYQ